MLRAVNNFGRCIAFRPRPMARVAGSNACSQVGSRFPGSAVALLPVFTMASAGSGDPTAHPAWPLVSHYRDRQSRVHRGPGAPPWLWLCPAKARKENRFEGLRGHLGTPARVLAGSCGHTKRPCRSLVTDISIWTECFATMAAILASAFPEKAPHFFTCLRTIIESSAWASYDMAFRRQAANRGSLDWGFVDPALYNGAFAGRARQIPRCRYCLADTHASQECFHAPAEPLPARWPSHLAVPRQPQGSSNRPVSAEICRLFNSPGGSRCHFPQCRYAHLCAKCRPPHYAAECGDRRQQPASSGIQPATSKTSPTPAA